MSRLETTLGIVGFRTGSPTPLPARHRELMAMTGPAPNQTLGLPSSYEAEHLRAREMEKGTGLFNPICSLFPCAHCPALSPWNSGRRREGERAREKPED